VTEKLTITAVDVGTLVVGAPKTFPRGLALKELKPGMLVMFVDQRLNTHPTCWVSAPNIENLTNLVGVPAMVVAIGTEPGKIVALALKAKTKLCHSCDGRVPDGHGVYALPEHLYTLDAWQQHEALSKAADAEQTAINELLKDFVAA
jgi:hypothetical protein